MVGIYFSGTGNTKFCVKKFLELYNENNTFESYSIEDEICVSKIKENKDILFAYPIYYSSLPPIVESFIKNNRKIFKNKNIFILATMGLFSGDGAGLSARLFKKYDTKILGGLHIKMPDCIGDVKLLKKSIDENRQIVKDAVTKIDTSVKKIKSGKKIKNGLTLFNHIAGLFGQRLWFYNKTKKLKNKLIIDYDKCISCKMCMVKCPVNNFIEENGKPKAQGKCTCCYRCISNCPKQAITLIGKEIYEQSKIEKYLG